ncbi:MAG: helix-turn-helix transcriptional regulator [Ruminococcus sp.]|nr:helix-turn-helix transcriptional regulator [Ruminococcus sp.]
MVKLTIDKILSEKGMSRYQLAKMTEIKYQTIDNYYKNRVVRYDSFILSKICEALGCGIADILTYLPDEA